jgi:hypothetical protein
MTYEAGNVWRRRAVDWLESHLDEFMPSGEPVLVKEAMAKTLLSEIDMHNIVQILQPIETTISEVYNEFIDMNLENASLLKLQPITSQNQIGARLKEAHGWIINRDISIIENPALREPIEALLNHFAGYYARALRNPNAYGGHIEIFALSKILNADIHVWAKIQNSSQYRRLEYMSYNSKPPTEHYRTINIIITQKIGAWGSMSGLQHFEVLFPWKKGARINAPIKSYADFIEVYPYMVGATIGTVPIDQDQIDILLQSLIDLSIQPKGRSQYVYDQLIEAEARKVATERKRGRLHPEEYQDGDYLRAWIFNAIRKATRIDLAIIINGLTRMVIRNVKYYPDPQDRILNSADLYENSDMKIRLDIRQLVVDIMGFKELVKSKEGHSIHNQILANAIVDLKVPIKAISESVKVNLRTLIDYLSDPAHRTDKAVLQLRGEIIVKIICRFVSDMYYYKDFRHYFAPNIAPDSDDLEIMRLLKFYQEMEEVMDFNGRVEISDRAAAKGYYFVPAGPVGHAQKKESEIHDILVSLWEGPDEDIPYLIQLAEGGVGGTGVTDIIEHMDEMELDHTRSNFDLLLSSI